MTSVHKPYDTRIFLKECRTLAKAGFDVTLIVPGQADAERDGVKFVTVPKPSGRRERMLKTARLVCRAALQQNADLYHFHDPELIPWGLWMRLRGKRVVYDAHEEAANDVRDKTWLAPGVRSFAANFVNWLEAVGAKFFNGIIASRPSLMEHFPKSKTALVNNFPILGELGRDDVSPFRQRPRRACYVGGLNVERGFREMVEGLGAIPDDYEFELWIAGEVSPPELVEEMKAKPGFKRLKLLGMQNREQVAQLLNDSRFGIVFFKPIANHINSLPTKLFEYASASLPTVGTNMPHWQNVIQDGGLGFVLDIENPKEVGERFMYLTDHPDECEKVGKHAKIAVETEFNWDVESKRMIDLYRRILDKG